jgi:hypothetical protein
MLSSLGPHLKKIPYCNLDIAVPYKRPLTIPFLRRSLPEGLERERRVGSLEKSLFLRERIPGTREREEEKEAFQYRVDRLSYGSSESGFPCVEPSMERVFLGGRGTG